MKIQEKVDKLLNDNPKLRELRDKTVFLRVYFYTYHLCNMPASITKRIFNEKTDNIESVLRSYRKSINSKT